MLGSDVSDSMAIRQNKKTSDTEKLINNLRMQMYGKNSDQVTNYRLQSSVELPRKNYSTHNSQSTEVSYLYKDLIKITILSFMALGIQFIIYYLIQFNFINLN